MSRFKVLYILDHAPNYRDKFLQEFGKYVDLTVAAYPGSEIGLKDPDIRLGYKFVELNCKKYFKFRFNLKEWTLANDNYDVIIVGFVLWYPFRMLNLFRRSKRTMSAGIIYGTNNNIIVNAVRKFFLQFGEGFLVYSKFIESKIIRDTKKPVIVYNNTYFSEKELTPLTYESNYKTLNVLWVGRNREIKKTHRLIRLAKRNPRVNVRLIGPGLSEFYSKDNDIPNLTILDEIYESELEKHFKWCHCVFNPGHAGLLIMNAARYGRAIFIDSLSHHAPEISLAYEANQGLIDFSNDDEVDELVDRCLDEDGYLVKKGNELFENMKNYTTEYMTKQFLEAIDGNWERCNF